MLLTIGGRVKRQNRTGRSGSFVQKHGDSAIKHTLWAASKHGVMTNEASQSPLIGDGEDGKTPSQRRRLLYKRIVLEIFTEEGDERCARS